MRSFYRWRSTGAAPRMIPHDWSFELEAIPRPQGQGARTHSPWRLVAVAVAVAAAAAVVTMAGCTSDAPTTAAPTATTVPIIEAGTYVVGDDIAPGLYRVAGYWARLDGEKEIIDNDVVDDGLTVLDVAPTDSYVEINGTARPIADRPAVDPMAEGFTDGTYLVGVDIAPGRYNLAPSGATAYFERLDATGDVIDDDISERGVIALVEQTDWAFSYSGTLTPMP